MKIIKYLFYLILILSNKEVLGGDYSISIFLDYLQEKGYYNVIQEIKNTFEENVAIIVCKQLTKSNDCEIVVRVYMTSEGEGSGAIIGTGGIDTEIYEQIFEYLEKKYKLSEDMIKLIEIILSDYYVLGENMTQVEIIRLIEKIIKNLKREQLI